MLQRVLDRAASMGVAAEVGLEFEWFNFRETPESVHAKGFVDPTPITPGMFGYSIIRQAHNQPYFDALLADLAAFDVPLEGLHTETGPGVFEAAIAHSDALTAADRAVLFKTGVKEIAQRFGILPTFMARWHPDLPGCSGHVHQSLRRAEDGRSLFHDPEAQHGMSPTFRSYVAGVLALLPELLVLLAPTVNSYKRLVDGYWAPTRATWGVDNRTVAVRAIPGSASSTRLELRVPGADVNPYLAVACGVAAGLWGVERELELAIDPVVGNGYAVGAEAGERLPRTLQEATDRLARSEVAADLFGDAFVRHVVETREWEWRRYCEAVTDWELKRYFEII
jgi:glutamine synthetase